MTDQQLLDVLGDWLNGRRDVTPEVADAWVALDALVADLARYRTALERHEALAEYTQYAHLRKCAKSKGWIVGQHVCDCGLDAALAGADDQEQTT